MDRQDCIRAIKCFSGVAIDYLPDILEPFSVYGKAAGTLVKMVKDGIIAVNKELDASKKEEVKKLKQEAVEEVKVYSSKLLPPKYMDCVIFSCKKGTVLSMEQKEVLREVLSQEYESDDSRSLEIMNIFIRQYMGDSVEVGNVDDCDIGDTYISFNFSNEYGDIERPYDKEDMDLIMEALNKFVGAELFDYYLVGGHDESNQYE